MKFVLFTFLIVMSANAFAARIWSSISVEDQVYLVRDLKIVNSNLTLPRSSKLRVTEITSMDMINVYLYKVRAESCPMPNETSELDLYIYNVPQNRGQITVGIELLRNCSLEIYVEKKDHKTKSMFN